MAALLLVTTVALSARASEGDSGRWSHHGSNQEETEASRADHIRFGALGGVGVPRPLSIEALVKIERLVALGAAYEVMPSMTIAGVQASLWAFDADLRVFPFRSAFFIGLRAGEQHLGAATTIVLGRWGSFDESIAYDEWFINPRLGFLWTWSPGFTIGIDAGIELPLSSSMSTTIPPGAIARAAVYYPQVVDITNAVQWLGTSALPTIDLLQVGMLF